VCRVPGRHRAERRERIGHHRRLTARPGGTFSLAFTATRALGAAPIFGGDDITLVVDANDSDDELTITATGVVSGRARDGERPLTVVLTGDDGAQSGALPLGVIVVDGTGPAIHQRQLMKKEFISAS